MYCNYKIYYNNSFVLFTGDRSQINKNFAKIFILQQEIEAFQNNTDFLFDIKNDINILVVCEKPGELMCGFIESLDIIVAGGGIVTNENDEILLIFRRGKWDMPKGKIELREGIADGAKREVTEETGVRIAEISPKPCITYHAYKLKGRPCLKETSWFNMKAEPGQTDLQPQKEEDIEKAIWVKKGDLKNYKEGCFTMIWDLLAPYADAQTTTTGA
jgi:ADP-ribose pyrophosphatase YjhB (NUDIX family)